MNKLVFLAVIFFIAFDTFSQAAEEKVVSLHNSYCKAIEQKDSAFLKNLFHDNMVVTSGNGIKRTKQEEIRDALDPRYKINYFKSRNLDVRVFNETVVVTGELFWEFEFEGQASVVERSVTFTYVKTRQGWQIVAQHIGRAPMRSNK